MSVTVIRRQTRLRSIKQMRHMPSGFGKGKWHSIVSCWKYKLKARRLRNIAEESRKRNRT